MRVMVLEDDKLLAEVWLDTLELIGMTCEHFTSCATAFERILEQDFDLFLFDYKVEDGTTAALGSMIRVRSPQIPVITITGSDNFANGEHIAECPGSHWLLRKPVKPSELQTMVRYLLGLDVSAESA